MYQIVHLSWGNIAGKATYSLAFCSTSWKLSIQETSWRLHLWGTISPHPSKSTCLKLKFSSKLLWNIGTISKRKDMVGLNWAPTSPSPNVPKGPALICCTSMAPAAASARNIFSKCGATFPDFYLFVPFLCHVFLLPRQTQRSGQTVYLLFLVLTTPSGKFEHSF